MSGVTAEAGRILLKRNSDPVQIILVQIIRKKQENPEIGKEPSCGGIRLPPQWRLFLAKKSGIRILWDIYGTAGKRRRFFAVRKSPKKIRRKHAESKKKSAEGVPAIEQVRLRCLYWFGCEDEL